MIKHIFAILKFHLLKHEKICRKFFYILKVTDGFVTDPDPLVRGTDPRIPIRIRDPYQKKSWIRNTANSMSFFPGGGWGGGGVWTADDLLHVPLHQAGEWDAVRQQAEQRRKQVNLAYCQLLSFSLFNHQLFHLSTFPRDNCPLVDINQLVIFSSCQSSAIFQFVSTCLFVKFSAFQLDNSSSPIDNFSLV
jgi:hypothetical protein